MLKKKFINLDEDAFVNIEGITDELLVNFKINKKGEIQNINNRKIIRPYTSKYKPYPFVTLFTKGKRRTYKIHILLANTFLEKEENKPIIDHINRDKSDYSLKNLRFATYVENVVNSSFNKRKKNIYIGKDHKGNEVIRLKRSEIKEEDFLNIVYSASSKNRIYKGLKWERYNEEIINFYNSLSNEEKSNEIWVNFDNIKVSNMGVIQNSKNMTLGSLGYDGYRRVSFKGSDGIKYKWLVHRLVYKAFHNDINIEEYKNFQIDHIDTNRENNKLSNLRLCKNTAENMKNITTRFKLSHAVRQYDKNGNFIEYYNSIKEASEKTNIDRNAINNCCVNKVNTSGKYIWCYEGREFEIKDKVKWLKERYWSYEKAKDVCMKYHNRKELYDNDIECYNYCARKNILDDFFPKPKFMQFTKDGKYIRSFENKRGIILIDEKYNKNTIRDCCKRKKPSYKGFLWCFEGEEYKILNLIKKNKNI